MKQCITWEFLFRLFTGAFGILKKTGQFTNCGQLKQNTSLLVTAVILLMIFPMVFSTFYYYLTLNFNKHRITFFSFTVFSLIILSLTAKTAELLAFYVAVDSSIKHHTQSDQILYSWWVLVKLRIKLSLTPDLFSSLKRIYLLFERLERKKIWIRIILDFCAQTKSRK